MDDKPFELIWTSQNGKVTKRCGRYASIPEAAADIPCIEAGLQATYPVAVDFHYPDDIKAGTWRIVPVEPGRRRERGGSTQQSSARDVKYCLAVKKKNKRNWHPARNKRRAALARASAGRKPGRGRIASVLEHPAARAHDLSVFGPMWQGWVMIQGRIVSPWGQSFSREDADKVHKLLLERQALQRELHKRTLPPG